MVQQKHIAGSIAGNIIVPCLFVYVTSSGVVCGGGTRFFSLRGNPIPEALDTILYGRGNFRKCWTQFFMEQMHS